LKPICLLFHLLTLSVSFAQESEYAIIKNGDTLYGEVTRATRFTNPSKIRFKIKDSLETKTVLQPNEVETIRSLEGVDGNCLIKTVYDQWFVKKVIDGRIEVYQLVEGVIYYTSKDHSEIKLNDFGGFNSTDQSHANIRLLLLDQPDILQEFDTLEGTERNILYIIEKYNTLQE